MAYDAEKRKERYEYLKANGLCVICGKNNQSEKLLCEICRTKINENARNTYKFYQENHICPICRKNDILGDEKRCPECLAKASENAAKYREKNRKLINENHKKFDKKVRAERKEKGLCSKCGKRKPKAERKYCEICLEKMKETKSRNFVSKLGYDREELIRKGLCIRCAKPVKPGYKICEKHYQDCIYANSQIKRNKFGENMKYYFKHR